LIALILQDGLFTQLNSVFFFKFFDHGLQKLTVSLLLENSCINLVFNLFLLAFLLHLVASELRMQFEVFE